MSPGNRSHGHFWPATGRFRPPGTPYAAVRTSSRGSACLPASTILEWSKEHARPGAVGSASGRGVRYSTAMLANTSRLTSIVEEYLEDLRRVRASGGATAERSTYAALANLFDSIGATLRPKVVCVPELARPGRGSSRLRPLRCQPGAARDTAPGPDP